MYIRCISVHTYIDIHTYRHIYIYTYTSVHRHMYALTCMVIIQRSSTLDVMDVVGSEDEYRELGPQRSLGCPGGCFG